MGVSFGNKLAVIAFTEDDATQVKEWIEGKNLEIYASHFMVECPVFNLEQKGRVLTFDSSGYGTYDLSEFTPIRDKVHGFVSMVDSRQGQRIQYILQVENGELWEDDDGSVNNLFTNDPYICEEDEVGQHFPEPKYPDYPYSESPEEMKKYEEEEKEYDKKVDELNQEMDQVFSDCVNYFLH